MHVVIDGRVCNGCGICVDSCPTDALRQELPWTVPYVAFPEDCEACFLCVLDCPHECAITVITKAEATPAFVKAN